MKIATTQILKARDQINNLSVPKDQVFYGDGLLDLLMIDRFKYKGRGRPRKIDYTTLREVQKRINEYHNLMLKARALL